MKISEMGALGVPCRFLVFLRPFATMLLVASAFGKVAAADCARFWRYSEEAVLTANDAVVSACALEGHDHGSKFARFSNADVRYLDAFNTYARGNLAGAWVKSRSLVMSSKVGSAQLARAVGLLSAIANMQGFPLLGNRLNELSDQADVSGGAVSQLLDADQLPAPSALRIAKGSVLKTASNGTAARSTVHAKVNGKDVEGLFDTAASITVVSRKAAGRLGLSIQFEEPIEFTSFGIKVRGFLALVDQIDRRLSP